MKHLFLKKVFYLKFKTVFETKFFYKHLNFWKREYITFEDFFHGHGGNKNTSLSFNNTLNKLVDVVRVLIMLRHKHGVQQESVRVIDARTDGENGGDDKRELLGTHGLDLERVVDRRNVEDGEGLPWKHPRLLGKLDVLDTTTGGGKILRCSSNFVTHSFLLFGTLGLFFCFLRCTLWLI